MTSATGGVSRPFSYDEAVALLVSRGIDENTIPIGSIQERHFAHVEQAVGEHCPARPLRALHVGNFIGVSLAFLSDIVVRHNPDSVVISVDPNLTHHDVEDPQSHVLALIDHFDLQRNNVVICGYSLERATHKEHLGTFPNQPAGEHTLRSLDRAGARFDLALLDGNHDQDYVRREIDVLLHMLADGGLLVMDDVKGDHTELPALYAELIADDSWPFEQVAEDDRIGILRRTASA